MKILLIFFIILTTIMALFAGCANEPSQIIGVALPTEELQRWHQDGQNIKKQLEGAGYEVDLQFAENKSYVQVSQVKRMISEGAKVLVIASIDDEALKAVLADAGEDIQVIAYDHLIQSSAGVDYHVGFDHYKVGELQGEFIVKALDLSGGAGPFNLEVFGGSLDDNKALVYNKGAMDTLQPYIDNGQLVVNSSQLEMSEIAIQEWKPESARTRMDILLTEFYADKRMDVVLSPNDSIAQGIVTSLKAAGYSNDEMPILTGLGCDITNVKMIIAGEQSMSVFKDTQILVASTAAMVDAILKGSEVPVNDTESYDNGKKIVPSLLSKPIVADISNYEKLLVDSDYYSEDQLK